jgi:hypothetical protein
MVRYRSVPILLVSILAACANFSDDNNLAWDKGWRKGKVTAVGDGAPFVNKLEESCKAVSASQQPQTRYATIRYRSNSSPAWRTVPIPQGVAWKKDDDIFINIRTCEVKRDQRAK